MTLPGARSMLATKQTIAAMLLLLLTSKLATANSSPDVSYSWVYSNPRFVDQDDSLAADTLDYTHMGMLQKLSNGQTAAAFQGSEKFWEGSNKQGIFLSVSPDGSKDWSAPRHIVRPKGTPVWAPVLHREGDRTWLLYSESRPQCWSWGEGGWHWACGGDIKITFSDNNGLDWSPPQIIYPFDEDGRIGKMIANKLIVGPDGQWLLPFWREMGGQDCLQSPSMHGKAGLLISANKGVSWKKVEVSLDAKSPETWLIEASISQFQNDSKTGFAQFFRTQVGTIYRSVSYDGVTWSPAKATSLPNPNSKVDSVTLKDGSILLAYNNNATARTALTLAKSSDGGVTWQQVVVLEDDPIGSFAYPTILYDQGTDEARVIYTVGYPVKPANGVIKNSMAPHADPSMTASIDKLLGRAAGPSLNQQEQLGAYGYNSYGMRLAIVPNVSELTRKEPSNS